MDKILILHGVNLNMLGKRNPEHYGLFTFEELIEQIEQFGSSYNLKIDSFQTNYEGEMVERIHQAVGENYKGIIINAGAWTHYSYAIRDALELLQAPIIEVHLSNIQNREEFRKISVFESLVWKKYFGEGLESYFQAIKELMREA